jgi:AAA+ ATPase superfamily predicted ATPase
MFIGRQKEMKFLRDAAKASKSALIPVYGRRRVGKSELILRFLADHPGLYFVGKTAPAALQKAEFCREAARALDDSLIAELAGRDWKTILIEIGKRWKADRKLVIVFDEFQWLVGASPELPSVLQELWDRQWSKRKPALELILCGSYVGFMEREVLGKKSPLFGRRTGQIHLKPLEFQEAAGFHANWSREDQARTYFVCGGVPWYHLQFDPKRSFEQNLADTALSELSPLYREPEFLLREELRDVESYYAVLLAIAEGCTKPADIAKHSGVSSSSLAYYLQQLVELGYVGRRFPCTGKAPVRRHVRYRLDDALLRFWFRFVFPNLSFIQRVGGVRAWRELIKPEINSFWGLCFERLCRNALPTLYEKHGITAQGQIGEYWQKDVQIDLVSRRDDNWVDLGECKWGPVRSLPRLAKELEEKVRLYPHADGMTVGRWFFLRKIPPKAVFPKTPNSHWIGLDDL